MKENYHGIHGILWISSVPVNCNFIHTHTPKKKKSDIEQKRKGDFAHLLFLWWFWILPISWIRKCVLTSWLMEVWWWRAMISRWSHQPMCWSEPSCTCISIINEYIHYFLFNSYPIFRSTFQFGIKWKWVLTYDQFNFIKVDIGRDLSKKKSNSMRQRERETYHAADEELGDESFVHQEMQDCNLPSFHQSQGMDFDMLSWLPLNP